MTLENVVNTPELNVNCHQFDTLPAVKFRSPSALDGTAITALIENSPPLDTNSAYCNLLQCSHFAQTCVVAESNNQILAWLSAYIPPEQQDHIFCGHMPEAYSSEWAVKSGSTIPCRCTSQMDSGLILIH